MEIKLWAHQQKSIEMQRTMPGFGFFHEMGCGKTLTTVMALKERMNQEKRIRRTLIITPPLVVPQWKEEWLRFSKIAPHQITLLQDSGARRLKEFQAKAYRGEEKLGHIFVTNYEALLMKPLYEALQKWGLEEFILDESHKVKSSTAQRSKLAFDLANPWDKKAKRALPRPKVLCLSGSPVLNSPLDIFMQVKIMLGGWPTLDWFRSPTQYNLIDNFYIFRGRYFRDRNAWMDKEKHYPNWQPARVDLDGFDGLNELKEILSRISVRATKADALDLPEEISVIHRVGMTKEQARMYKEMKDDLISYFESKACVASLAITKALRLMQIVSGFVSVEGLGEEADRADIRFEGAPKDAALEELLGEITGAGSKALVWAVWQENYGQIRAICDKLKITYVESHGQISEKQKRDNIERFKASDGPQVLIGHPGSGGIGLNLTGAPYSIFYSRTRSLEHYLQARSRNHRGGQTQKVTHYDLACVNTVDEVNLAKLAEKAAMAEDLLAGGKVTDISMKDLIDGMKSQG